MDARHFAERRCESHKIKAPCLHAHRTGQLQGVSRHLAPHVARNGIVFRAHPGDRARTLEALACDVAQGQAFVVDIVILDHLGRVLQAGAGAQRAQDPVRVLRPTQVVSGRTEFRGERAGCRNRFQAHGKVSAPRNRPLRVDLEGGVALVVARDGQGIDAVRAFLMHPMRLTAIPVGQDAATDQAGLGPALGRERDFQKIVPVHPMVVVDEGHQRVLEHGQGSIQCMGLARRRLGDPLQGQRMVVVGVVVEKRMRTVGTRVGHHEQMDAPARRLTGCVERVDDARQQIHPVVGADQDGQRVRARGGALHGIRVMRAAMCGPSASPRKCR